MLDIYIINLDKDIERLNKITKIIHPYKFKRIKAIYGKNVNLKKVKNLTFFARHFLPRSAIGIYLSHIKTWKTILNNKNDMALVLEDDAKPIKEISQIMNKIDQIIKSTPSNWDIIKLQYINLPFGHSAQFGAYIINKKGIDKCMTKKINFHIDFNLKLFDINIYHSNEVLFIQEYEKSNNQQMNYVNPFSYTYLFGNYFNINYKIFRINNIDFSAADYILMVIILIYITIKKFG
jgi:GR25 family glycosyltransferase involved in LPS biosynthesis